MRYEIQVFKTGHDKSAIAGDQGGRGLSDEEGGQ